LQKAQRIGHPSIVPEMPTVPEIPPVSIPGWGWIWSRSEVDRSKAVGYLNKVLQSSRVAEVEFEEANRLLKKFGSK
jgi:hypothetical protein